MAAATQTRPARTDIAHDTFATVREFLGSMLEMNGGIVLSVFFLRMLPVLGLMAPFLRLPVVLATAVFAIGVGRRVTAARVAGTVAAFAAWSFVGDGAGWILSI